MAEGQGMSKLITASLISAVNWAQICPPSWKERALTSLHNQLARIWDEKKSPEQTRGHEFENMVYALANKDVDTGTEHFKWIVKECNLGIFQKTMKKLITIDSVVYCLYGKADAWFPYIIKDVKTTDNWKGAQKYLGGFQHKLYCYMEHIENFRYVVGVFSENKDDKKLMAHHAVDYRVEDWAMLEAEVILKVKSVVAYIRANEEWSRLYDTTFSRY